MINSYNNESNKFTFPSDGMVRTSCNYRQGSYVAVIVYNGAGSQIGQFGESSNSTAANAANQGMWIPVYKNWSCYVTVGNTTSDSARFYPYGYNEWVWRRTA